MQGDVMEYGGNLLFFQVADQPGPGIEVWQQDMVHVGIMAGGFRGVDRSTKEALPLERLKQSMIAVPDGHAFFGDFTRFFELGIEEGGHDFTRQVARADVDPGIFIDHATEELAAVGAFFADDLGPVAEAFIVDQECATFAADEVFGFMEAEAA